MVQHWSTMGFLTVSFVSVVVIARIVASFPILLGNTILADYCMELLCAMRPQWILPQPRSSPYITFLVARKLRIRSVCIAIDGVWSLPGNMCFHTGFNLDQAAVGLRFMIEDVRWSFTVLTSAWWPWEFVSLFIVNTLDVACDTLLLLAKSQSVAKGMRWIP